MSFWAGAFRHHRREASHASRTLYAKVELAHTFVDFGAAICFLIGSIMFFSEEWQTPATWFFTIGSVLFCVKPTLRLWREVKLYRMGKTDQLADRAE
ncbi:YrhK family protein [Paracoccus sp. 1_MG-2023]|uniref:YrhK family protein n=1 Tax=unclassified Paracoccus (in: a-proteobacteria) TaxID=2688777 RepID=UPI001C0917C5|nr:MULTISPECIES: YrhK family protein [unclassified Paracoccus (in: a-proteobacteria)]MBU2958068.1 YrhK family protein [Paracoccus sp. C2R09]MDO6669346.1 YrhK family protein [Paracoccus sp. 1_MG-2023]